MVAISLAHIEVTMSDVEVELRNNGIRIGFDDAHWQVPMRPKFQNSLVEFKYLDGGGRYQCT